MLFFIATSSQGAVGKVRELTKLGAPAEEPQLVLLDIPDEGGFYVSPAGPLSADTIVDFLDKYKTRGLERQQLGK